MQPQNDKFFFPLNYKFSAKFLGIIEYKNLLPIVVIAGLALLVLYIFQVNFFVSFGIIILICLPSILILSVGVNGQPAIPYFKSIIKFSLCNKKYLYK